MDSMPTLTRSVKSLSFGSLTHFSLGPTNGPCFLNLKENFGFHGENSGNNIYEVIESEFLQL